MGWARNAWMAVTLLAFAAGSATAGEPKRVLLLHSFGWNFQAEDAFASYLRTDLAEKSPYSLDRYEVSLEIARFGDGERDEAFADYLRALFATRPPDLIITMVSPAARFIQRHRRDLFPSTPVIFAGLDARTIKDATLTANDTMVAVSMDLNAVIANILRTLPNTTTLAVVIGDTPIEKFWVSEFLRAFHPYEGRVKSVFMNDLSFGEIQKRVAALPPASAIYFGYLVVDAQGVAESRLALHARRRPSAILARCSVECFFPRRAAPILARCSVECFFPRRPSPILARLSAERLLPRLIARSLALCSAESFLPTVAARSLALCSAESFLPMLAALSLARAPGEITLPIDDALILARVSSEVCLPRCLVPAFAGAG